MALRFVRPFRVFRTIFGMVGVEQSEVHITDVNWSRQQIISVSLSQAGGRYAQTRGLLSSVEPTRGVQRFLESLRELPLSLQPQQHDEHRGGGNTYQRGPPMVRLGVPAPTMKSIS